MDVFVVISSVNKIQCYCLSDVYEKAVLFCQEYGNLLLLNTFTHLKAVTQRIRQLQVKAHVQHENFLEQPRLISSFEGF
jgi:hypothetical protein